MKKITLSGVMGLLCLCVNAQSGDIKPLAIGDIVPDIQLNVVNAGESKKLSSYPGKILILDLWSTTCASCIEAFPKMQELQNKFNNDIQIILANPGNEPYETDERVKKTLARFSERTGVNLTLPIALHDTVISQLFPHRTVPHLVIIGKDKRVLAITSSSAITQDKIDKLINGQPVVFPIKNELGFERKKPLFVDGNGGEGNRFLYRSLFTPEIEGGMSVLGWDKNNIGQATRFYIINKPLLSIYTQAFPELLNTFANRIIIEAEQPQLFKKPAAEHSVKDLFCYELIAPDAPPAVFRQYFRQDLERAFGATAKKEKRSVPVYVLTKNSNIHKAYASASDTSFFDVEKSAKNKSVRNQPFQSLTDFMNTIFETPVVDETGISTPVSINFPFNIYDYSVEQWKLFLSEYGIGLKEAIRELDVAVIKSLTQK